MLQESRRNSHTIYENEICKGVARQRVKPNVKETLKKIKKKPQKITFFFI